MPNTPLPRHPAPALTFPLLGGGTWSLAEQSPDSFTLVVFYRGLHCPVCKSYLQKLVKLRDEYGALGVEVVAVSMDGEARARTSRRDWELADLPLGYDLDAETARRWGLYLSEGIKDGEPERFSEPGLFLVRPDAEVYYAAINSAPWGRPHLASFVKAVKFITENDYPARGELPEGGR